MKQIDKLIINSPYEEPKYHWHYDRETRSFEKRKGRRPAGYIIATPESEGFDDPGIFRPIELVEKIRPRVKNWRENKYPGISGITKRLLNHWKNPEERVNKRFFFCQLEAIETLIWLTEAPESEKTGIEIPGDGGDFARWCCKMATGTGKTVVMAMFIVWQLLNKITNRQDTRFAKDVLIVAPGLTVKSRLSVLNPSAEDNYYEEFNIVPVGLIERLRQGRIKIINWHKLAWESEEQIKKKKSVDKRGPLSNEAYTREVLGEMANSRNFIVINDEAHHAWRINVEARGKYLKQRDMKDSAEEATVWIGGLDRLHKSRGILRCFDLSATPFAPSGKKAEEEALYNWIVSDFGLNDSIESGLVKTPRVVIRDDSKKTQELKSRLYHIYMDPEVKDNINRKAKETSPLPDLVHNAYYLLGMDWLETKREWEKSGQKVPPVMITVANRTETAARIKHSFDHKEFMIEELCDPEKTLHIDSKVLREAESSEEEIQIDYPSKKKDEIKLTKKEQAEYLRRQVDTVGKIGQPGENIQNVISVGMLSEGWDAKSVTHIMGLRAFTSQLLCEQVVGRGLRRTSYEVGEEGHFEPEYVNIFGVPFTFLPHEGGEGVPPPPPKPKTAIEPDPDKKEFEISWPNVIRIDYTYHPELHLEKIDNLHLNPYDKVIQTELTSIIEGKPVPAYLSEIDLKKAAEKYRLQRIIFETAKRIYNSEKPNWKGSKGLFLAQIIRLVENFIKSKKLIIDDDLFSRDPLRKRVLILLNINKIVQHIWNGLRAENTAKAVPVFDSENPIRTTAQMRTWYTSKPCEYTEKSHINFVVVDSGWEENEAYNLDKSDYVKAWAKNDHLGFVIFFNYKGEVHKYYPDFIVKLKNEKFLILETKGNKSDRDDTKRSFLKEWVNAVNNHGGFGVWHGAVSFHPNDLSKILKEKNSS